MMFQKKKFFFPLILILSIVAHPLLAGKITIKNDSTKALAIDFLRNGASDIKDIALKEGQSMTREVNVENFNVNGHLVYRLRIVAPENQYTNRLQYNIVGWRSLASNGESVSIFELVNMDENGRVSRLGKFAISFVFKRKPIEELEMTIKDGQTDLKNLNNPLQVRTAQQM